MLQLLHYLCLERVDHYLQLQGDSWLRFVATKWLKPSRHLSSTLMLSMANFPIVAVIATNWHPLSRLSIKPFYRGVAAETCHLWAIFQQYVLLFYKARRHSQHNVSRGIKIYKRHSNLAVETSLCLHFDRLNVRHLSLLSTSLSIFWSSFSLCLSSLVEMFSLK